MTTTPKRSRLAPLGVLATAIAIPLAGPAVADAAVTSTVTGGVLKVTSDNADAITVTTAGGNVKVNTADPGAPTAASAITAIEVTGGAGANTIDLSAVNAATDFTALVNVKVEGGEGNDTITGTTRADNLDGQGGNDRVIGARGNDTMLGGAGLDTLVWNNGDGSDLMEGQGEEDTTEVNGANGAGDVFTINPNGARVKFDRTNLVPFTLDIGTTEKLDINEGSGDGTVTGAAGLAALIRLDVDGGEGTDLITGGDGADVLAGGPGNDRVVGFRGNDTSRGNDGEDTLVWNNGDGSDVNEGDSGSDTIEVNGAGTQGDIFTVKPNGPRVRFDRTNLVPFFLDIGGSERMDINGGGGDDTITGADGLATLIRLDVSGDAGNDTLTGGDGPDLLAGGDGDDTIRSRDAVRDEDTGGNGVDTVVADALDFVSADSENVQRPDVVGSKVVISKKSLKIKRGKVVVKVQRPAGEKDALQSRITIKAGTRTLGSRAFVLDSAAAKSVRVTLGKKALKAVRQQRAVKASGRKQVTLRVAARDSAGNVVVTTRKVTLKV